MSAAEVTTRLGIEPTYSHEAGDLHGRGHRQRRWAHAIWSLSTEAYGRGPLGGHLARLLDRLEPKRAVIEQLAHEGYAMDWFCFVSVEGQGGVVLSVDLLQRLAALPIELSLDLYGL